LWIKVILDGEGTKIGRIGQFHQNLAWEIEVIIVIVGPDRCAEAAQPT
jgi:hypothetical protein